jgi:hypothetical protein
MKWPPPPLQPWRAQGGRPLLIRVLIVAKVSVPDAIDRKQPTRVSALSRYHGLLQDEDEPVVQHVVWPSSALTIVHCVQVEAAS